MTSLIKAASSLPYVTMSRGFRNEENQIVCAVSKKGESAGYYSCSPMNTDLRSVEAFLYTWIVKSAVDDRLNGSEWVVMQCDAYSYRIMSRNG